MKETILPTLEQLQQFEQIVSSVLKNKPILREIKGDPTLYVGDLHGFNENLKSAFKVAQTRDVKNLVFLGDYIDRGPEQIRCALNALASFAISEGMTDQFAFIDDDINRKQQFNVITLRGNHDDKNISAQYDFLDSLFATFNNEKSTSLAFNIFDRLFRYLPIMVETDQRSIALHGGIPNFLEESNFLDFPDLIRNIKTPSVEAEPIIDMIPRKDPNRELKIALGQIVWNDALKLNESLDPQFLPNMRGEGIFEFNRGAWLKFAKSHNYRRLIRAHDSRMGAFDVFWNNTLVHVFSTFPYFGHIDKLAFFLEYKDGTGEIVDGVGKTIQNVKKPT
jgi:predicted phosphodiesterase